jgi:coronin-1B/1C/6
MSASKFKNAIGEDKKEKFTNCSVTSVSTEGRYIAVNGNFLAMSWSNMGEVVVVDSSNPISISSAQPRIKGHRANILDLEFSPFSSDLLACAYDDFSVLLYKIPEGGLKENMTQEVQLYQKHTKKVPFVTFNPVASDVVCSGAFLGEIHIWNVLKGETYVELKADDTPTLVGWNPNGTLVGCTTKNKMINIFDPRTNKMILKQQINEAFQSAKFAFLDNDTFVTTSWTKTGAKMLRLWDVRKVKEDLSCEGEVTSVQIDTSKTVTTPFVDKESKLLYCVGKGEASTHVYDYNDGTFRKGINSSSTEPSISSVMFERKCLDYNKLEVDRFARYVNSGKVYYVSFTIPRRNPGFDPSLYPPVECGEPALTYDKWVGGETAEPVKKDINTIESKFVSQAQVFEKKETKVEKKTPEERIKELEGKIVEMTCKINLFTEENAKLRKQIEAKKAKKGGEEAKPEEPKTEEPKPEEPKPEEPKPEEPKTEEPKPEEPKPEEPKPEEPKPDEVKVEEVKVEEEKVEQEKTEEPKEETKPEA